MKLLILILTLIVLPVARGAATSPLDTAFQDALMAEEGRRDLLSAIRGYQSVIELVDSQRQLAATALFRLGECYRKLGRTNDAVAQYQRLVREYPGETSLADLSRQNLAALGTVEKGASQSTTDAFGLGSEEQLALNQLRQELRDSPDVFRRSAQAKLKSAIETGSVRLAEAILDAGADVNGVPGNRPPLHIAAERGQRRLAEILLARGADINRMAPVNVSQEQVAIYGPPIYGAAFNGPDITERQAIYGTVLHVAVAYGNETVAELLLSKGASLDSRDTAGNTPLHAAVGSLEMTLFLIAHGAKVSVTNLKGETPLHLAARYPKKEEERERVAALLKAGADPNVRGARVVVDSQGQSSEVSTPTPLVFALIGSYEKGHLETARLLLAAGGKVRGGPDRVALAIARTMGDLALLKLVIGATDRETLFAASAELVRAALGLKSGAVLKVLLDAGVSPDRSVQVQGETFPLMTAVNIHFTEVSLPASQSPRDSRTAAMPAGLPPIGPAVGLPMVGGSIPPPQWQQSSPSSTVSSTGTKGIDLMRLLIDAKADVNATNSQGSTVLHVAAAANSLELVDVLLAAGASVEVRDAAGQTPMDRVWYQYGRKGTLLALPTSVGQFGTLAVYRREPADFAEKPIVQRLLKAAPQMVLPSHEHISVVWRGWRYFFFRKALESRPPNLADALLRWPKDSNAHGLSPQDLSSVSTDWPDFLSLHIRRGGFARRIEQVIDVGPNWPAGTNCAWNRSLEWGDQIEVPELTHIEGQVWNGHSESIVTALDCCTRAEVTVESSIGQMKLSIRPAFLRGMTWTSEKGVFNLPMPPVQEFGNSGGKKLYTGTVASFELGRALNNCPVVPLDRDFRQVKVKRKAEGDGGIAGTHVIDISAPSGRDFLLQDGDLVEIPSREQAAP